MSLGLPTSSTPIQEDHSLTSLSANNSSCTLINQQNNSGKGDLACKKSKKIKKFKELKQFVEKQMEIKCIDDKRGFKKESKLQIHLYGDLQLKSLMGKEDYPQKDRQDLSFCFNKKVQSVIVIKSKLELSKRRDELENEESYSKQQDEDENDEKINNNLGQNLNGSSNIQKQSKFLKSELHQQVQQQSLTAYGLDYLRIQFNWAQDLQIKSLLESAFSLKQINNPKIKKIRTQLEQSYAHSLVLQNHFDQIRKQLGTYQIEKLMLERSRQSEQKVNKILQDLMNFDSSQQTKRGIFYIKTEYNYITAQICQKEIGYSEELLKLLKISKSIPELVEQIQRGNIQEIFSQEIQEAISSKLLSAIGSINQESEISMLGNIIGYDKILIPANIKIEQISLNLSDTQQSVFQYPDLLTVISIHVNNSNLNHMNILRKKYQKRQSFKYRTLFPSMASRKMKIDKLLNYHQFKNIQQEQHLMYKFYPQYMQQIEQEIVSIQNELIQHYKQQSNQPKWQSNLQKCNKELLPNDEKTYNKIFQKVLTLQQSQIKLF